MKTVRLNQDLCSCFFVVLLMMILLLVSTLVFHVAYSGSDDCQTDDFMKKFCSAVALGQVQGGACSWVCDTNADPKRTFRLCPKSDHHHLPDTVFLHSNIGPVFAMNRTFFEDVLNGYQLYTNNQLPGETFRQAKTRIRYVLKDRLNVYLNQGYHQAILNSVKAPGFDPIPAAYLQSLEELLQDRRFVTSLLFYGTGERNFEPPGSSTESVSAVSLAYTCAGLYQTYDLVNNTTPLTYIFNRSATSWTLGASIDTLHLYEIVGHLLDIEETVSEHEYEGQFYLCNLNASQILLHNDCVKPRQSINYKLDHPCTLKVLDISKMLFSRFELERQLSLLSCKSNHQCRFHSCEGECDKSTGKCVVSHHTQLSGLMQICGLIKSIEGQLLEANSKNSTIIGHLYYIIDRCLDLRHYPVDIPDSPHHLVSTYNTVFQELKLFFIDLHDIMDFDLKRQAEVIAARKEQNKQAAKKH